MIDPAAQLEIDVRDTENIWIHGKIIGICESKDSEPKVLVHYVDWSRKYDELIPISSH